MKKIWKLIRRLFRKRLKPKKGIIEKEVVAGGFVGAGDYLCIKDDKPIR